MEHVDEWEKDNDTIPMSVYKKAAECGMLAATVGWPEGIPGVPTRPKGYDGFMTIISQVRPHPLSHWHPFIQIFLYFSG